MDFQKLLDAHEHCFCNRSELEKSRSCGCVYCGNIFRPKDIVDWTDCAPNETALCPECGVDAVLPESAGYPVTEEFLEEMRKLFFEWDVKAKRSGDGKLELVFETAKDETADPEDEEFGFRISLHAQLAYFMP